MGHICQITQKHISGIFLKLHYFLLNLHLKFISMQAGLFAKKLGMTQIFDESGTVLPVTILKTGVCQISQIKTITTDGYNAVQVAYGEDKLENINKPTRGHLKKIGAQGFKSFGEFRVSKPE